jgi:hypothetical protein
MDVSKRHVTIVCGVDHFRDTLEYRGEFFFVRTRYTTAPAPLSPDQELQTLPIARRHKATKPKKPVIDLFALAGGC